MSSRAVLCVRSRSVSNGASGGGGDGRRLRVFAANHVGLDNKPYKSYDSYITKVVHNKMGDVSP